MSSLWLEAQLVWTLSVQRLKNSWKYFGDSSSDVSAIKKLNDLVETKANQYKLKNMDFPPEVNKVLLSGDFTVYIYRWMFLPPLYTLISLCTIIFHSRHIFIVVSSMVLSYLYYDFFSGILHIVLDNPEFLNFPFLDVPCLEFQWHHQIPTDGASKSFNQCCGDLNVTVVIIASIFLTGFISFFVFIFY